MIKLIRLVLWIAAVAALAVGVYLITRKDKDPYDVGKARISDIESMARLCTIDIYNEAPVLDTINNKVIFAIQKQRGSISFDLDSLDTSYSGDTVIVTLPRDIVEIHESTDPDSWQVIDTKSLALFVKDRMSLQEENAVKSKIRSRAIRQLYENGTVARARSEAAANLRSLLEMSLRHPVRVIDPDPDGSPYR